MHNGCHWYKNVVTKSKARASRERSTSPPQQLNSGQLQRILVSLTIALPGFGSGIFPVALDLSYIKTMQGRLHVGSYHVPLWDTFIDLIAGTALTGIV